MIDLGTIQRVVIKGAADKTETELQATAVARLAELNAQLGNDCQLGQTAQASDFIQRRLSFFERIILTIVEYIQGMDQAIGHDRIHLAYDIYEVLGLLKNDKTLSQYERAIVLLGGITHDLGRYAEEKLFGKPMATTVHAALGLEFISHLRDSLADDMHDWSDEERVLSDALWRRVEGCIAAHFGGNATDDQLRHWVQSGDRLAGILGIRCFARNLACDMLLRGCRFWPDPKLSGAWEMAPFNNLPPEGFEGAASMKASWTNVIHYIEAPMRTCYPLVNANAEARADELKAQAARLLFFLGSGSRSGRKYPQGLQPTLILDIFAPELVVYERMDPAIFNPPKMDKFTRWDKGNKALSEKIWRSVWADDVLILPGDVSEQMEIWRKGASIEYGIRSSTLVTEFLDRNAYTLDVEQRDVLMRKILEDSQLGSTVSTFQGGFAYALAEGAIQAEREQSLFKELARDPRPLLTLIAKTIEDEPIFQMKCLAP